MWYPDFMGKDADISYPSTRVLGMMYRLIEPAPEYQPLSDISIDTRFTSKRILTHYLQRAGQMKQEVGYKSDASFSVLLSIVCGQYDVDLEGMMRQYVHRAHTSPSKTSLP
jgi:hypothetical protein